jgi:hypothetical protein
MVRDVPMSDRVRRLPLDPKRGIPVPWFVAWIDGQPDFRVADKFRDAVRFNLCWVCGQPRGRFGTFVIGPMCAVNRTTAEPPSHLDCGRWSAQVCPFLARPHARRRENDMPDRGVNPGGEMIKRNPGVTCLWTTRDWRLFGDDRGGWLFEVGEPSHVEWWSQARTATRNEVEASVASGLPLLQVVADEEGPDAVAELQRLRADAERWYPGG